MGGLRVIPDIYYQGVKMTEQRTTGQKVGYIRVSSVDQNDARQLDGVQVDRTFTDKASGKDTKRPELERMLEYVREGDTVFVHSMDRLARNLDDLRRIVKLLTKDRVEVRFIKEGLVFNGDDTPMSNLLLSVMGAFAEFERQLIKERQREGIAIAKQKGIYKGRRPSLTPERIDELRQRAEAETGVNKTHLAKQFGISRETLYQMMTLYHVRITATADMPSGRIDQYTISAHDAGETERWSRVCSTAEELRAALAGSPLVSGQIEAAVAGGFNTFGGVGGGELMFSRADIMRMGLRRSRAA